MNQHNMQKLLGILIAIFFIAVLPLTAHAAKPVKASKERLVLMPLRVAEEDRALQGAMETALVKGLQQKYEVFSGEQVSQKAHEIFMKESRSTAKKECDETRCMQGIAEAFQAELIATASVTKREDGYFLALSVQNIFDNKVVYSDSIACKNCDAYQVVDKLKEMSGASVPVAAAPPPEAPQLGKVFKDCPDCPEMVVIPAGSFDMGSNADDNAKPVHRVSIGNSFAVGKTEVTQGQWKAIMGNNPSKFQNCGDNCPVEKVSWDDANEYIQKLNAKTGKQYRLPSEAEWEYACRAGGKQKYCGSDNADSVAWYDRNSAETTHAAAQKQANAFGLYDMSGNVWEWVADSYHDNYNGAPGDGSEWQGDGANRVLRGGSMNYDPRGVRSADRDGAGAANRYIDGIGFRLARTLITEGGAKVQDSTLAHGSVDTSRGRIGVTIQEVTPALAESVGMSKPAGALVSKVEKSGPADLAGIKPNDVILKFGDKEISLSSDLPVLVAATKPRSNVAVQLWRNGANIQVSLVVGAAQSDSSSVPRGENGGDKPQKNIPAVTGGKGNALEIERIRGLFVSELSEQQKTEHKVNGGLIVESLTTASARNSPLKQGDLIFALGNVEIHSFEQLSETLKKIPQGRNIALLIQRGEEHVYVSIKLDEK